MGNGITHNDLPTWGQWLVYLIKEVGLPTLVIIAILGMYIGWFDSPMQRQHEEMLKYHLTSHQLLNSTASLVTRNAQQIDDLIDVNRVNCVNNAKTNEQRERCVRPQR